MLTLLDQSSRVGMIYPGASLNAVKMEVTEENGCSGFRGFISMPNFRVVDDDGSQDENRRQKLKLYRSSRPDFLTESEVLQFKGLGIRCIIDLRSVKEYSKANGRKGLDACYPLYKIKLPLRNQLRTGDTVKYKRVRIENSCTDNHNQARSTTDTTHSGRHFLVNFFKLNYIWTIYNRAPWYLKLYSLLFLAFDVIFNTGYTYFVRFFAEHVLNKMGLAGHYIDMVTHSQGQICAVLKLLTEPENVPAMLNCAHGKDRTGVVSALILAALGTSKEDIAEDYGRSEGGLVEMQPRLREEIVDKFHMHESFLAAKAETMMEVLNYIEAEYGSLANYLEYIGFGREDQEKLKENLTQ